MRRPAPKIVALGLALALVACGDAAPPRSTATARALPSLAATGASPDDVVVARVDERPVWGSCVAAQAKAERVDAKTALQQCIDLELAAQEAERRGLATDPDVGDALEQALASRFVEREFSQRFRSVADLPASVVEPVFKKNAWRMHREEYRGSFFARIELPESEKGTPADVAAGEAAQKAYATLASRADLFPDDVEGALRAAAGPGMKVSGSNADPATFGPSSRLQAYYHEPLFAIPAIGQVAPPVRGAYGWDIILFTTRLEPLERTREQVLEDLWPALRLRYFMLWSAEAGKGHVQPYAYDDATLQKLLGGDQ
ncbi:MAG TPA: hypothetical protein VM261_08870 [Kofleriaceae bacterium]|nr:hypothetical protein [Kofleriaceae bacterium]